VEFYYFKQKGKSMNNVKITLLCAALAVSGTASAGWLDFLNQTEEAAETVQNTTATVNKVNTTAQTVADVQQVGLVDTLVKQLGVSKDQAQGGAGALFQTAKGNMTESAFGQVSESVPGMDGILAATPKPKPASSTANLLTGLANASGNSTLTQAASLVSMFEQLDMSKGMVSQFTPIVVDYVKENGGEVTANLLKTALAGM